MESLAQFIKIKFGSDGIKELIIELVKLLN